MRTTGLSVLGYVQRRARPVPMVLTAPGLLAVHFFNLMENPLALVPIGQMLHLLEKPSALTLPGRKLDNISPYPLGKDSILVT